MRMSLTPVWLLTGLVVLNACGQSPLETSKTDTPLPPGSPYANGAQYPWTDKLETSTGDPYGSGKDYAWTSPLTSPKLHGQALKGDINFLSDLPWISARSGWGPVERDQSNGEMGVSDGRALSLRGRTFEKGLGVHADSQVDFSLNGQCQRFGAAIGIDDETRGLGRATFLVVADGKTIYTSPELTGQSASLNVDVDISGVKQLSLRVVAGANNFYDHADWAGAHVECVARTPAGDVNLSELPYSSATNGWGPVEVDQSNGEQLQFDGKSLSIAGQTYAKGLGVHAPSTLTYLLDGKCSALTATVGLDDEVKRPGSVTFRVVGDGKTLFDSGLVSSGQARALNVDVSGVNTLELKVTDGGDNKNYDHANWANPVLKCAQGGSPVSDQVDTSYGVNGLAQAGGADFTIDPDGGVVLMKGEFNLTRLSPAGAVTQKSQASVPGISKAIARQPDGKLVVVGYADPDLIVARFNADLTLDTTFGAQGVLRLPATALGQDVLAYQTGFMEGTHDPLPFDIIVQGDGRVLVAGALKVVDRGPYGEYYSGTFDTNFVLRLTPSGSLDNTYGQGGVSLIAASSFSNSQDVEMRRDNYRLTHLAFQPDGKLIAAGTYYANTDAGANSALAIRLLPDGRLDSTFKTIRFGGYTSVNDLKVQADGKIIMAGTTERYNLYAYLKRFNADGSADTGGTFEFVPTTPPEVNVISSVAPLNDGSLLLSGYSTQGGFKPYLWQVPGDTLNASAAVPLSPPAGFGVATSMYLDASGHVLAANGSYTLRINP